MGQPSHRVAFYGQPLERQRLNRIGENLPRSEQVAFVFRGRVLQTVLRDALEDRSPEERMCRALFYAFVKSHDAARQLAAEIERACWGGPVVVKP